jgi:hypothetical protein
MIEFNYSGIENGGRMPLLATAQLEFINQMPLDAAEAIQIPVGDTRELPRPELAGCKVRVTGTTPVYLIDRGGYRRLIPSPLTFLNLFQDKAMLQVLVSSSNADISEGPPLDDGAVLFRGRTSECVYLLDHGKKRLITCQAVMDKYEFSEESIIVAPQILVDAVPEGEVWE